MVFFLIYSVKRTNDKNECASTTLSHWTNPSSLGIRRIDSSPCSHAAILDFTKLPASLLFFALRPFFLYLVVNMPGLNNKVSAWKFLKKLQKFLVNRRKFDGNLFLKYQLSEENEN